MGPLGKKWLDVQHPTYNNTTSNSPRLKERRKVYHQLWTRFFHLIKCACAVTMS